MPCYYHIFKAGQLQSHYSGEKEQDNVRQLHNKSSWNSDEYKSCQQNEHADSTFVYNGICLKYVHLFVYLFVKYNLLLLYDFAVSD